MKNAVVDWFAAPMAVAALGFVYHLTDGIVLGGEILDGKRYGASIVLNWDTNPEYEGLMLVSAILFCLVFFIYFFKIVFFPKKFLKVSKTSPIVNISTEN